MILRVVAISVLLAAHLEVSCPTTETFENVTFCQLAKDAQAFRGSAYESAQFILICSKSQDSSPQNAGQVGKPLSGWIFDDETGQDALRQIPQGMGTVLAVFIGKIETGKVYGPNGERVRLVVDRIEKVEKKVRGSAKKVPAWVPRGCP